ncbi:hypothetical protein M0813_25346 [Anaeramoeba flamelloides]|uniref:Uncharacterized protein n=1 Tax=Anaeramoeba flamelloides TaxID=1746091 RepID=A0ABQ8Y4B2_9EUKA|nr:hypothetical protein M0813_25346 [Anaeramoeba flamelloides]
MDPRETYIILPAVLNFLIGLYCLYRLIRILRTNKKNTLQTLCYVLLLIGLFGKGVCFSLVPVVFRTNYFRLYASLQYLFSFINTYAYVTLIPLQAQLYYLFKDAEDLVLQNNHSKNLKSVYIVTIIFSLLFFFLMIFTVIFADEMLGFFNYFHLFYFLIIMLAMLYYGIKLIKIINRIGGKELTKQIKRIIIIEIQWCILWTTLSLFRITKPEYFDEYGILVKPKYWIYALLLLCVNFPALALLFVVFKSPSVKKNENLLLNSYDSSSGI